MKFTRYAHVRGIGFAVWSRSDWRQPDIAVELTTPFGMFALDIARGDP